MLSKPRPTASAAHSVPTASKPPPTPDRVNELDDRGCTQPSPFKSRLWLQPRNTRQSLTMSFPAPNITPPGWYPGTENSGSPRWWDGQKWVLYTSDLTPPTAAQSDLPTQTYRNELTGSFAAGKLPRIATGSVTVTIARTVKPGCDAKFIVLAEEMIATVSKFPGCLGATMLYPGEEFDEYHSVFRFTDAIHLRQWERSTERNAILAKTDDLVSAERVTVTAGGAEFFAAQTQAEPHRTKLGSFISEVAWVYPLALGYTVLLGPLLDSFSVFVRALVFTALIGLTSRLVVAPFRLRWHRRRMLPQDRRVTK